MKKVFILCGMTLALLAGCSTGDDLMADMTNTSATEETTTTTDPTDDDENITREDLMGDFPIELGTNFGVSADVTESTRGSILDEDFSSGTMGVFCISANKILEAASNGDILRSWSGNVGKKLNLLNLWQDNVKAHVSNLSFNNGKIVWDDPNTPHYYPNTDYFNYTFVAYHPYTSTIQHSKSLISAYVQVDGDDDVIYSMADGPAVSVSTAVDKLAYGTAYFKGVQAAGPIQDDHKPYFHFQHLTAKLQFNVQLKSASARQFHVDSICFSGYVNTLKLNIAKHDGVNVASGISQYPVVTNMTGIPDSLQDRIKDVRGHFWLRERDGSSISGKKEGGAFKYTLSSSAATSVGDCIMIPPMPSSAASSVISLEVYLRDEDGNRYSPMSPISVTPTGTGWEMGKVYNINVKITPPSYLIDDTRGASVDSWEAVTTETIINVEDNEGTTIQGSSSSPLTANDQSDPGVTF